ncbi:MAG: hypothetical protein ACYTG5_05655 [Planctomycetota bacterium]|jgi:hypothetical protein
MLRSISFSGGLAVLVLTSGLTAQSNCLQQSDLRNWTQESYAATNSLPGGSWVDGGAGSSVTQGNTSNPTFFVSEALGQSYRFEYVARAAASSNGYFGIAIGFEPGDSSNPNAEYWLIDWKSDDESVDWGAPSCTSGSMASVGLAVSRVFGIPTADEFWGHMNESAACSDLDHGLEELARGAFNGNRGWQPMTDYNFRIDVGADSLRCWVDGNLEFEINGPFANSRIAFYNFDQEQTEFTALPWMALASTEVYGEGMPGCVSTPSISLSTAPALGTWIDIIVDSGAQMPTHGCLVVSTDRSFRPTIFGFPLLVDWTSKVLIGFNGLPPDPVTYTYPIAPDSALCGVNLYMQLFHFDDCAPAKIASSPGLSVYAGMSGGN